MIMSGTGSRFETKAENGMAHFLEHMFFKGTKQRPTAKRIAEELDGIGGVSNAFTDRDHTAYFAKVDARHFATALDVVSDIFLNATLPAKEIERERGAVLEEINLYEDMPMANVLDEFDQLMFGTDHPLGRSILGPKENIRSFTRAQFKHYFERNYIAGNSAVCIAGNFSPQQAISAIRDRFSDMRDGAVPEAESYSHTQHEPQVRIKQKKTDQTHFVLGVPSYGHHHVDEVAAEVLAAVLGGGMSSRLFSEVRERRGLAYYVKADVAQYDGIGNFYMRAGVTNGKLADAVTVILAELKKLTRTTITAEELKKAQEYVKGTTALSLEASNELAHYIGHATLVRGTLEPLTAFNTKIDAVTAADIKRVAKELFRTDHLNLMVIGPHKGKEKTLRSLLHV